MPSINKHALVPYSVSQMYDLVSKIEIYPEFLPWCSRTQVLERDADQVRASIDIAYSGLNKTFTTQNRLQQNKMIEMRLVEGPFRHLEGYWRFDALNENACKVSLDLEFEFSSKLVGMAMGPVFTQIANSMVDAFCKRAVEIYGKG